MKIILKNRAHLVIGLIGQHPKKPQVVVSQAGTRNDAATRLQFLKTTQDQTREETLQRGFSARGDPGAFVPGDVESDQAE
jgi:hypothetical protein